MDKSKKQFEEEDIDTESDEEFDEDIEEDEDDFEY